MARFKAVATDQLRLLFLVFVLGSAFRAGPSNPPNACGSDLYRRLVLAHHFLVLSALAAALLLLAVQMAVYAAEAGAVAAARASADADGYEAFDAEYEAAAAAIRGIGSVAAKWRRMSLRAMLLLAVDLVAAASFLAVVTLQDGFRYRIGCDPDYAWYHAGRAMGAIVVCLMMVIQSTASPPGSPCPRTKPAMCLFVPAADGST